MIRVKHVFFHVFFPLLLGGCIYLFFRETSLLFFSWFKDTLFSDFLIKIRHIINPNDVAYYNWSTQILPDGLWCYSYSFLFFSILNKKIRWNNFLFFLIPLIISISIEYLQYFDIIIGTFDLYDIFAYILAVFLSLLNFKIIKK